MAYSILSPFQSNSLCPSTPLECIRGGEEPGKIVFSKNFGVRMAVEPQKVVIFSWKKKIRHTHKLYTHEIMRGGIMVE